jgi:hypothetical protein
MAQSDQAECRYPTSRSADLGGSGGCLGARRDGQEGLALFDQLGVSPAIAMSIDVLLRFGRVYGVPTFRPLRHIADRSATRNPP